MWCGANDPETSQTTEPNIIKLAMDVPNAWMPIKTVEMVQVLSS